MGLLRTDFHSHILPRIDDGAANVEEALNLLKILKQDGVKRVVATPHLYLHRYTAEVFLEKRQAAAQMLALATVGEDYPEVIVGAEVFFSPALSDMPLEELCIAGTDFMLLELPYSALSSDNLRSLINFLNSCNVKIILAHIERYYEWNKPAVIDEILSYGVLAQGNCDSVTSPKTRKSTLSLIESGRIQLLGTDLHGLEYRPPTFGEAQRIIEKKLSPEVFTKMMKAADMALNNDSVDDILSI